jgi:quinol monooxygenase YgiN
MSRLTNLAFFRARLGQTQALGSALSALVAPTRAEAECLNYDLHQSVDDAEVWFVYENWRSAEGSGAHMRAPHVQAFLKVAPDLIADDIDLRRFSMITTPTAPRA